MHRTYRTRATRMYPIAVLGLLVTVATFCRGAEAGVERVALPAGHDWDAEATNVRRSEDATEVVVPINYKIGRVVSAAVPAGAADTFTFAAEVRTRFDSSQGDFYRFWVQLECLREDEVVETFTSPELIGTQPDEQLLAVTAQAPSGTTAVRVVLCAQNKFWSPVVNQALVRDLRLLRLGGGPGRSVDIKVLRELPSGGGDRAARLVVRSDWPTGTAVAVTTTRGTAAPAVLLDDGRAEVSLSYAAEEAGRAEITARVGDSETRLQLPDPHAATLSIDRITADGEDTPVLVQLTQEGEMLPGRYQASVPGLFVTPPWTIDLAPGRWQLRISRGPQFQSREQTLECISGATIELGSLEMTRNVDLSALGWYGGDGDGDVYHGEAIYKDVNAETAAQIAQAMGLDWVGVGRWAVGPLGGPSPETWGEARAFTRSQSHSRFLFMWTDERPKSDEGHACFVGLDRPDADRFGWGWAWQGGQQRDLRNFEILQLVRASGGATYANHPLRWWMKGTRFNTNMYSSLPFDLCAAGLIDGVNVNDKPDGIQLWSMLLDHGYRVSATAGADFCLDRPSGPPPGVHRMYCHCPDGLRPDALADAIRNGHTIVSTGPVLVADLDGKPPGTTVSTNQPHRIRVRAWARGDHSDAPLQRLELWAHGRAVETRTLDPDSRHAETTFEWTPEGESDWVAVRAVARGGWAITSAFYAADADYRPPQPLDCHLELNVSGLDAGDLAEASVEVWDGVPSLVTARRISRVPLRGNEELDVAVSATVVVSLPDGRRREVSVYDATGMSELIEEIASGSGREKPLLEWKTYEQVLERVQRATAKVAF
jgi:hypothetical protein